MQAQSSDKTFCYAVFIAWCGKDESCSLGFLHKWHELCAPVSTSMVSALVSETHKLHRYAPTHEQALHRCFLFQCLYGFLQRRTIRRLGRESSDQLAEFEPPIGRRCSLHATFAQSELQASSTPHKMNIRTEGTQHVAHLQYRGK